MTSIQSVAVPHSRQLPGYMPESEMAVIRGVKPRTLRSERQKGSGPPFVKINRKIFYPIDGFREWLKAIERRPVRAGKAA
jgi:hypothetical protein